MSDRAVTYVRDCGGSVTEDALIAFVFGSSGTPALWQPLLKTLLAKEDRLVVRADGRWSLIQPPALASDGLLSDFIALDVETTGLQPLRHRIIEVALIRFTAGQPDRRFSTLVNPDKRIPKFISNLTTINDELVEDAPRFQEIALSIEEFLGDALLVGHNVGFDIGFINAELERAGRPRLINERLDVMGLASRLVPGLRRPSLDKAAAHFGLSPRKIHRAETDAELAGNVALHLASRARDLGIDTLDRLRSAGRWSEHLNPEPVGRARSLLDRSILATIPKCPGVYLMRDANGQIIYVGKAKCLRDRVSSYFSQPLGYTRKMDGLIESIARIDIEETGSELAALLLESQLIRRYHPRYNVVMRASEEYPYIQINVGSPWPRIMLSKARKENGSVYFGPFKSRKSAKLAIELVTSAFSIRTCTRTFTRASSYGNPCLQLDIGKCPGPCTGHADRDEYMRNVHQAVAFLDGDDDALFERFHEQLEESATALDFERARRIRNNIRLLQTIVGANRQLKVARESNTLLLVQPGPLSNTKVVMLIFQGVPWSTFTVDGSVEPSVLADRLAASWSRFSTIGLPPLDHHLLDDVVILNRWIARSDGCQAIIRFSAQDCPDWLALSRTALAVQEYETSRMSERISTNDEFQAAPVVSDGRDPGSFAIPSVQIDSTALADFG